jgi:tRNA A37 N6-isopentenylltransferase MiaA
VQCAEEGDLYARQDPPIDERVVQHVATHRVVRRLEVYEHTTTAVTTATASQLPEEELEVHACPHPGDETRLVGVEAATEVVAKAREKPQFQPLEGR